MQDRPTAPELLDALAVMLFSEVREWVPREHRFQILVAANICAVVARELRAGSAHSLADAALFRSLLGADEAPQPRPGEEPAIARAAAVELVRSIRAGALDGQLDRVIRRLREHVERKLEVARPGYARD